MSTLFGVPVDAAYHLVFALTSVLTPVLGPVAAVAGIIVITIAVRLLVSPLTFRALRGQAAQTRLAPEIQRLRQRYGKQPDRLQRELTALYQQRGHQHVRRLRAAARRSGRCSASSTCCSARQRLGAARTCCSRATCSACRSAATGSPAPASSACTASSSLASSPSSRRPAGTRPESPAGPCRSPRRRPAAPGQPARRRAGTRRRPATGLLGKIAPYLTVLIAAFAPLAGVIYLVTSTGWSAAERLVFAARSKPAG